MSWTPREQELLSALRNRETWERWGGMLPRTSFPSKEARKVRGVIEKLHKSGRDPVLSQEMITRAVGSPVKLDTPLPASFVEQWVCETELLNMLGRVNEQLEREGELGTEEFTSIVERLNSLGSPGRAGPNENHSPLTLKELFDGKGFERRQEIPTFIDTELDEYLGGGVGRGQLCVLAAPPKRGKTTFLLTIAYRAARHGFRTLFLSCENYLDQLQDRLSQVHGLHRGKKVPALLVQYHSGLTVEDARLYAGRCSPDFVIVDYEGTMGSRVENDFTWRTVEIYQGLRQLADQENLVLWTASQAHEPREGRRYYTVEREDIWGSNTKIQYCDLFLSLNLMPRMNRAYVKVLGRRGRGKEGQEFRIHFDPDSGEIK